MAMTKAVALAEVRRRINEPTANFISDTEINGWLDRGARNVSVITGCAQVKENEDLVASQMIYPLTVHDWIEVTGVVFIDGSSNEGYGLGRIHLSQIGHALKQETTSDEPKYYATWGTGGSGGFNILVTVPAGSITGLSGASLDIYGYEIVDDYGTSGTNLPDSLNPLAVTYAIAMAHIKNGNHAKAAIEFKKYMNGLMIARNDTGYNFHERVDTSDMRRIPDTRVMSEQ